MVLKEFKIKFNEWLKDLKVKKSKKRPSNNTIKSYSNAVNLFTDYLEDHAITEVNTDSVRAYEEYLHSLKIKASTFNTRVIPLNKCFRETGLNNLKVDTITIEKKTVNDECITESEYRRLIKYSKELGFEDITLLMQVLVSTGIRISELAYFTPRAVKEGKGKLEVHNKGKQRTIIIPKKVRSELLKYAKKHNIKDDAIIFHARRSNLKRLEGESIAEFNQRKEEDKQSKLLDKAYIWRKLQRIAGRARIKKSKVHCHSFRYLYSQLYLKQYPDDIANLANLMGHSSIETTRLYATLSTDEYVKRADSMFENI